MTFLIVSPLKAKAIVCLRDEFRKNSSFHSETHTTLKLILCKILIL